MTYDELEGQFEFLDDRVDRIAGSGRKGAWAAVRDAAMNRTTYAFGLRRNELCRLDVADLRPHPHVTEWGTYGSVHVRFGKGRGRPPRRRTVLAVPEFDWAIESVRQWVEQSGRPARRRASGAVGHRTLTGPRSSKLDEPFTACARRPVCPVS